MSETKEALQQRKKDTKRRINDTYGWVRIARRAIQDFPATFLYYKVPTTWDYTEMKNITRRGANAKTSRRRILEDIYTSAFIYMVAIMVDYINTVRTNKNVCSSRKLKDFRVELNIHPDLWEKWQEVQQVRNVWVHNAGIVNENYTTHVKEPYRVYQPGQKARLDHGYFEYATSLMKELLESIQAGIDAKLS